MRLDIATPSASRTSGQPTTSTGRSRSAAICRTTASCWKSLRPKYARHGPTIENSFVTTVVTPSKCVGPRRAAQALGEPGDVHRRQRRAVGYISSTVGTNSTSTPSAVATARVAVEVARVRGEVLVRTELRRVHEERDDDEVRLGARRGHQRPVAVVEVAHRRHEADGPAGARGPARSARAARRPSRRRSSEHRVELGSSRPASAAARAGPARGTRRARRPGARRGARAPSRRRRARPVR